MTSSFPGIGDAIFDARLVHPDGFPARLLPYDVTISVQSALVDLFSDSFPALSVVSCDLGWGGMRVSLPTQDRAGGWSPSWWPPVEPVAAYLLADPELVEHCRKLVPTGAIGLCWASGGSTTRALPLEALRPIWSRYPCVSLQVGPDREQLAGTSVLDVLPSVPTFADTAALIMALRCVVCVDTSVWHLAGGLGVPVHLILRGTGKYHAHETVRCYAANTHAYRDAGDVAASVGRIMVALS